MKGLGPKKMRHIDFKARPFHGQAGSAAPPGVALLIGGVERDQQGP
jgi:hypothetical protein